MKKHFSKLVILGALLLGFSLAGSAQIYVKIRPVRPVIVRTEPPGPHHVWVDEEWEERNGRYEYAGGHWLPPPPPPWSCMDTRSLETRASRRVVG